MLTRVLGHYRNMLILPSGEKIYPGFTASRMPAAARAPVRQYQFVQTSLERITVKLSATRALTSEEEAALVKWLREVLRHSFEFDFVYVDEIPRSASGKYEEFKSELAQ